MKRIILYVLISLVFGDADSYSVGDTGSYSVNEPLSIGYVIIGLVPALAVITILILNCKYENLVESLSDSTRLELEPIEDLCDSSPDLENWFETED